MTSRMPIPLTMTRMTEGRKLGGPQESWQTGGERTSRGVRAARVYHTIRQYRTQWLAWDARSLPRMWSREGLLKLLYLKLISRSLKFIPGYR